MSLPAIVYPEPGEAFMSWAHRLSAPYLCTPEYLFKSTFGIKTGFYSLSDSEIFKYISSITGGRINFKSEHFQEDAFSQSFYTFHTGHRNLLQLKLPRKVCWQCFEEDHSAQRVQYLRRSWGEPWRITCCKHKCILTDIFDVSEMKSVRYSAQMCKFQKIHMPIQENVGIKLSTKEEKSLAEACNLYDKLYLSDYRRQKITGENYQSLFESVKLKAQSYELSILVLTILLLDQKPIHYDCILNWWLEDELKEKGLRFPVISPGCARDFISDLSTPLKIMALSFLIPFFQGDADTIKRVSSLIAGPKSPLRNNIRKLPKSLIDDEPLVLVAFSTRPDMLEKTITFLKSRKNRMVPRWERAVELSLPYMNMHSTSKTMG